MLIPNIQELIIKHLNIIDKSNLSQISRAAHRTCKNSMFQVTEIDLVGEERFKAKNLSSYVKRLVLTDALNIKSVKLQGTLADSKSVTSLVCKCLNIEKMELGEMQVSEKLFIIAAEKLKCLKDLRITNTTFINRNTLGIIGKAFPKLEALHLDYSSNLDDNALRTISTYMGGLKSLSIRGCEAITDHVLQLLLHKCKPLEYLDVSFTRTMAYPTCVWISNYAKMLKKINVANTRIYNCGSNLLSLKFKERGLDPEKSIILCKNCTEYCPNSKCWNLKKMYEHARTHFEEPSILREYRRLQRQMQQG